MTSQLLDEKHNEKQRNLQERFLCEKSETGVHMEEEAATRCKLLLKR